MSPLPPPKSHHTFADVCPHRDGVFMNAFEQLPSEDGISILGVVSVPFARHLGAALIAAADLCSQEHEPPVPSGEPPRSFNMHDPQGWGE